MLKMIAVGTVTERFVTRQATTAKRNFVPSSQVVFLSVLIYYLEVSIDDEGAIIVYGNLCF